MARAIEHAFDTGEHLLVQAGTGTGKSLGYLAPALAHLHENPRGRVIVATATLALQAQLANSDIPAALDAAEKVTGRRATAAILKGRTNYACLHRAIEGTGAEQDSLLGGEVLAEGLRSAKADTASVIGAEVVALREWVQTELDADGAGDRDDAPTHTAAAWAQVSVPVRECLGQQCAFFEACFVERSRETARNSQLVVTNHALLAIDAMHGNSVLPEHDFLVIDEAHELTSRVTGAASHELSPQQVERVARRCLPLLDDDDLAVEFLDLGDALQQALDEAPLERIEDPDSPLIPVLQRIREVSRAVVSELKGDDPDRKQAAAAAKEVFDVAEAMAALKPTDVLWVSERERFGRWLVVAPLDVAGLLRERVLSNTTTVLTSATLKLGGDFESIASSVGLARGDRLLDTEPEDPTGLEWRALDVGSPFDYARQGILYVAQHLPNPRRDGITPEALAEVAELVWAAGGRTLGLFASQRNAEAAARHCRAELPKMTFLCQGDAQLSELTRRFIDEPATSLFGTLSLWQGVDVPGETCQLVIIDKIPFPRPDEPLLQARQQSVAQSGGNGFMAVAATHAALLLAQGSGRLIRRLSDRGVVAVLDPRLRTARYGSFLRASMPGFWSTTDREVAVNALRRLGGG
ncbi:ATP-dependent DNA helicase [Propioniciclava sp. MC1683]|uniref:ATP-dependent DNA helicase n=1 Tax=Propioniciclava sp. MC1683 TaxID=2760309 RepID=UPI0016035D80|nr:ATP-dependent DNA helicase [Propioniciclava sp. MC1683]MBB1501241.1 ATP-dependent DNA helicase [Propioniciclava sp. MC1683]